jgi:hypothetical protein
VQGNGHRPPGPASGHGQPKRKALVRLYVFAGGIIALVALAAGVYAVFGGLGLGGAWVAVGSASEIRSEGVAFDAHLNVFVVFDGPEPVGLWGREPQLGGQVFYCGSSGWFQSDASLFDHHGFYRSGRAPRGLDRVPVKVDHGLVMVDPSRRALGPDRGLTDRGSPAGEPCGPAARGDPKTGRMTGG